MRLACLRVAIEIQPGFRSKRKTVRAILEKIHRHFNVSVVELEGESHPSQSTIGVAALSASRRELRATLGQVADALTAHPRANVLNVEWTDH